jgi:tetratricopeptide (TPR) repeat protein
VERRGSQHHLIVVADIEGFGNPQRTSPHLEAVRAGLDTVMRSAFAAARLEWEDCYREMSGDAVFALVPGQADKAVFVETALSSLVTQLRIHNDTHPETQRIRLRVALHAGEVTYDAHGVTSTSLIRTFRLSEAPALRAALAASPGVLAVIASDQFFDDVIRHIPAAAPTTWRAVHVAVKEADVIGWVSLPDHPYLPTSAPAESAGAPFARRTRQDSSGVVPRQLPAVVRDFTGRAEHLAALDALIPPDPAQGSHLPGQVAQSVVITAVDGAGGIGKTTLALYWAHRVQDRFPDGTLHVNLRGYGPGDPATSGDALSGFLRALGVAPSVIPTDVDAQAALLRSLAAGKRLLFVLDNAYSAEQIRPLLPGTPGCMVVVTSRDSLTGLVVTDAAHRLTLDLLTPPEAYDLVEGIIGANRVAAEPEAASNLIRLCARLPLALRIAAGRVAAHSHLTIADVVAELTDDRTRLDILSEAADERSAIRAVFDWSYRRLSTEQAGLFRRLGLHPGPDLSVLAAAALAELPPADVRPMLTALAGTHLIELAPGGRYRFHDLLRTYAADLAHRHDTPDERDRALDSLLTWYTHTTYAADQRVHPYYEKLPAAVAEATHLTPDFDVAWAWLTTERTNIVAVLQYAAANHRLAHHAVPLAHATRFLTSVGSPQDALDATRIGVLAAHRTGNPTLEAFLLLTCAEIATQLSRWDQASENLDRAATLIEELNDIRLQLSLRNARGLLFLGQERFDDAARWFVSALPLTRRIDAERWEAVLEGNLSAAYTGLGHYERALEHGERNLHLRRLVGDLEGESGALTKLAHARHGLNDLETAISLCRDAVALGRRSPNNRNMVTAEPLAVLASYLHQIGHTGEAIDCWRQAATLYTEAGYPRKAADVRQHLNDIQTS